MDAKLKKKWLKALRSGEYIQAKGQLRSGNGYCCLGVLCRVAGISIQRDGKACSRGQDYRPIYKIVGKGHGDELMCMNDRRDYGFSEIADYIERNL